LINFAEIRFGAVSSGWTLSPQQSAVSQNQTLETRRNGGRGGGEEGLRRINADERGLENPNPPTPDMYRIDTPEAREAYEARFGGEDRSIWRSGHRDVNSTGTSGDRNTAEGGGAT